MAYPDRAAVQARAAHACLAQQLLTAGLAQWQRDVLNSVKLACVSVGVGAASYSFCAQLRPGSVTVRPAASPAGFQYPDSLPCFIDGRCSRRWLSRRCVSRGLDADI